MTHRHNHPGPFTLRLESLESRRLLSAGALDPSFSVDGKATFAFGGGVSVIANDVAVQGDGKTLVVGETISGKHFAVARFNLDGTPDTSFGGGTGRVLTHFGGSNDYSGANAVVIQPDGKIVVAGGTAGNITVHYNFAVARYNSDGSLDKTFDGDGKTSISFGVFSGAQAHAVALQRDGKIVLAGYDFGELSSEKDFAVARLHANGSPDLTFNLSGKRIIGLGGQDEANAVAIDYSGTQATNPYFGSILVGGESIRNSGNTGRFAAVRLNIVGGFINSFDGDGKLSTIVGNRARAYAKDLIIQNDGKFILAGSASSSSATESDVALVRYNANGTLDSTFGSGDSGTGQVLVDFGGSEQANGIVRNYDGSGLLVAGTFSGQFGVTLLNNNGSLDTTFGTNGLVRTNLGGSSGASGIARGPGRRFLLTGGGSFSTARYFETGANLVYATVLDFAKTATETAVKPASFFVHRLERLSVATRVYFAVGGTARYPGGLLASARDYNLDGMTSPALEIGTPYVDIPANQTFAAVYLNPKDDARLEPNETAIFRILSNAAYEVGTPSSVTLNIIDNDSAHINFQTDIPQSAGPEFVKDTGQLFGDRGNGLAYGWDADNTANTRIRNNPRSPDFRYDSLARMQSGGVNRTWEIAVPNGLYQVRVVAGDPDFLDSIYKLSLEGSAALTGTPHDDIHWFRRTVNVQVSDGRLTLGNAAGSSNNKICFIDIKAAPLDATVGNATADIGVHLLPPPTARTSAFHWTVGRLFSDQRIEELDSRVAPSARAQIRLAQAILSGTCPTTRPLEATAPTGSSLTPARSLPTSSRPFAI